MVLSTAKLWHRKSISWLTMRGGNVSIKKFDGIHDRFQRDPTYRDSQLKIGWTEEKCIEMDNRKTTLSSHFQSSSGDTRKTDISH